MQQRLRAAEQLRALGRLDRADERDLVAVDARRDSSSKYCSSCTMPAITSGIPQRASDLDRLGRSLVGMDAPEEEQIAARRRVQREGVGVDAVVDGREVVEARMRGRRR